MSVQSIGRDMRDCGKQTPLARFVHILNRPGPSEAQADVSRWIIAHLNELTNSDFELLKQINSKFHIVHCPRSHQYFGHEPFQFERRKKVK